MARAKTRGRKAASVVEVGRTRTRWDALPDETVLSLAATLRSIGDNIVPGDPNFFKALRLQVDKDKLTKPYAQNPWVYAANQAVAIPIAQVPFRLYTEDPQAVKARKFEERLASIRRGAPMVSTRIAEAVAMYRKPRERFRALQRHAPWISSAEMMRAVGDVNPIEDGPWYELFRKPNPTLVRPQLWEATLVLMGIFGECFWQLGGKLDPKVAADEIPKEIWPMGPTGWDPILAKDGKLPAKWVYKKKANEKGDPWEPFQLVRMHQFSPYNPLRGLSPLDPVDLELQQSFLSNHWNLAFFKNSALPGGYIMTDRSMDPQAARQYLEEFERRHGGARKQGRPVLFDSGMKFVESQANHRDMQFAELEDKTRDAILGGGYRVTKTAVGLIEGSNRASALSSLKNHWETVLLPKKEYLEDLIDADLFTPERTKKAPLFGVFDLADVTALRADYSEKLDSASKLMDLGYPANMVNDALELNMPTLPWGDAWFPPATRQMPPITTKPAEFNGTPEPPPAPVPPPGKDDPAADDGGDGKPPKTPPKDDKPAADKGQAFIDRAAVVADEFAARGIHVDEVRETLGLGPLIRTSSTLKTVEHWEALIARVYTQSEERFAGTFRRYLWQLRAAQLGIVGDAKTIESAEAVLFPLIEWQHKAGAMTAPVYKHIYSAAEQSARDELRKIGKGMRATPAEHEAQVFLGGLERDIGRAVKTVRRQLATAIDDVLDADNWTNADVATAIRSAFNDIVTKGKLGVVARTETSATISGARDITFRDAGVDETEWLTAGDELVRDNHVIYGDQGPVPIGTNFAQFAGESYKLEYPLDRRAPAGEVVNCRCVCVPN